MVRSAGGQRRYAASDLDWLAFLLRLRATGMSIADMRHFTDLRRSGDALNVGLSPVEVVEALTHAAVYCGFPKALNAVSTAKRVFAERGLLPVQASPG